MTAAGALVLLINDHLLKQAWPGFVTGKLSDVAGLVVAPALVALLFRRRADLAATVLTGVLFALVKTTETGAEAASQAWTLMAGSSRVLADPTDLLALPALGLAWWVRDRTLRRPLSSRWRLAVTMPLAVLAVTATAAAMPPLSAESVEVDKGGRINVHTETDTTWVSDDGGRTWSEVGNTPRRPGQSAQCVPAQATRCYRIVENRMAVEQSDDGGRTWRPSWKLSGDALERLTRQYDHPGVQLRAKALAVQAQPGGHVVVVANGVYGIVIRDISGAWRHVGLPGIKPAEVDLDPEWGVALFLAACVLFGGAGAGLRRHTRAYTGFALTACLSLLILLNGPSLMNTTDPMVAERFIGLLAALTSALVCLVLAVLGRARPVPAAVGLLASPLVYASVYLPFVGWSQGAPDSYTVATVLAALLTALVLLAGAALIRYDARRANPFPDDPPGTPDPT